MHGGYNRGAVDGRNRRLSDVSEEQANGTKVFTKRFAIRRARDEKAQERFTQKRTQRQEGHESQAGDSHWPLRGAQQGKESTPEKAALKLSGEFDGFRADIFAQGLEYLGDNSFGVEASSRIHRRRRILIDETIR